MYRYPRIILLSVVIAVLVCATNLPLAAAAACDRPVDPILLGACQKDTEASESKVVLRCVDSSTSVPSQPIDTYAWYFAEGSGRYVAWVDNKIADYEFAGGEVIIDHRVMTICNKRNTSYTRTTFYCNSPAAGFTVDRDSGVAPLTVRITDTSRHTPADVTTLYYEKDNRLYATHRNPTLTFSEPGTYTITQFVKKTCSPVSNFASRTIRVKPPSTPAIVASMVIMNLSSATTTTTVTTTVTPTVTTTTVWSEPVVPVYVDTRATGFVPGTTAPTAPQTTSATQQSATAGASPAPSQAPGAPGNGTLSVTTNPAGAQVFVDDVMWGASPAIVPGLSAGPHTLRLVHTGYQNMSVPVTIMDGKTAEYSFTLVPESGGGMGMLPIIAAVVLIAAAGGGAYWYMRKKGPGTGGQT